MKNSSWFFRNSLSLVFLVFAILSLGGQIISGRGEYNEMRAEHGLEPVSHARYLHSGHFIQATFENWESEFLQMAMFVYLTIYLYQKGSSESRIIPDPSKKDELTPLRNSPWPVKKGGLALAVYQHSLTLVFVLLFLLSYGLHLYGSWLDFNENQWLEGRSPVSILSYFSESKLWFESFQNWQSEFLSICTIVFLSIYLRQKGSPQSKPVHMPHSENE